MAEINEEGIIVSDQSIYVPQTWIDGVDECTPINAERLNHMELGIADVAERCDPLLQTISVNGDEAFYPLNSIDFSSGSRGGGWPMVTWRFDDGAWTWMWHDSLKKLIIQHTGTNGEVDYHREL